MPYFKEYHNDLLAFPVIQIANSPSNANFTRWPCTGIMSGDPFGLHHNYGDYEAGYTPWINRRNNGRYTEAMVEIINKANPVRPIVSVAGKDNRMEFTTIPKAIVADASIIMRAAGDPDYRATAIERGYADADIVEAVEWMSNAPAIFDADSRDGGSKVSVDRIMLPRPSTHVDTVIADFEMADGGSAPAGIVQGTEWDCLARASQISTICRRNGKKAVLWPNALNAPSQLDTRITENNAPAIHAMFDTVLLPCGANAESNFWAQVSVLRGGARLLPWRPSGVGITIDVASSTEDDALAIYGLMTSLGLDMLMIWPNGSPMGGNTLDATNRKISLACFGNIV